VRGDQAACAGGRREELGRRRARGVRARSRYQHWRPRARADEVTTGLAPEQSVAVPQGAEREVLAAPTPSEPPGGAPPRKGVRAPRHPFGATGSLGA